MKTLTNAHSFFYICIPLSMIFGCAEDYKKVIINAKHKLILIRSRTYAVLQVAPLEVFEIISEKIE